MDIKVSNSGSLMVEGKIVNVSEVQKSTKTDYEWRIVVVEVEDGKYAPQKLPIKFGGKYCGKVADVHEGDLVNVSFYLEGNEWNGRWYTSLRGVQCTIDVPASVIEGEAAPVAGDEVSESIPNDVIYDDDMPF